MARSKHYSGYLPVGNATGTAGMLHYWLIESERDPANDPAVLWCDSRTTFAPPPPPPKSHPRMLIMWIGCPPWEGESGCSSWGEERVAAHHGGERDTESGASLPLSAWGRRVKSPVWP